MQHLAGKMAASMQWDDEGPSIAAQMSGESTDIDDEYRRAGVDDPKIFITTSHSPSSRLKMFAKVRFFYFYYCR